MNADQKAHFDNHPKAPKMSFTSDGMPFFEEEHALDHAKGLKDNTVVTYTRAEAVAWTPEAEKLKKEDKPQGKEAEDPEGGKQKGKPEADKK